MITTFAPSRISRRADARPRPEAPPVTRAVMPSGFIGWVLRSSSLAARLRGQRISSRIVALARPPPSHMVCRP